MSSLFRVAPALFLLLASAGSAQTATVLFDEAPIADATHYQNSSGEFYNGDFLDVSATAIARLPLTDRAFRGVVGGRLSYEHVAGGSWLMFVGTTDGATYDLSGMDSLIVHVNGPVGVLGPQVPSVALQDMNGETSAALPLPLGGSVGFNNARSGFVPGSPTNAQFAISYVDTRSSSEARPGYPEDLTITFADVVLDTSKAAIGVPATPAAFRIDAASGLQMDFRFRDLNGDNTLGSVGEYVEILTRDSDQSATQRPTWRLSVGAAASVVPAAGSAYLLAVDNGGIDTNPDTWQRVAIPVVAFGPLGDLDITAIAGIRFGHRGVTRGLRTVWFDAIDALDTGANPEGPAPPTNMSVAQGDSSIVFRLTPAQGAGGFHVYRRTGASGPYTQLTARTFGTSDYADLTVAPGQSYSYIFRSFSPLGSVPGPDSDPVAATAAGSGEDPFLDLMAERAFDFFWSEANPTNGLIKDRSTTNSASSIAAVGFGLTTITIGIDRGYITRAEGVERVQNTLRFLRTCPQNANATEVCGYKGFFYHFLDMETGHRAGTNELSSIDTALLLSGVLDMAAYFTGSDADEVEIRRLAREINDRADWQWFAPRFPAVSLGWHPENGYIGFDWIGYNEAMILYILAMGSPTHPLPATAWDSWTAGYSNQWGTYYGYSFLTFPPLFGHQYSHLWVDFRGIQDDYMRSRDSDYFENSKRATLAQQQYGIDNPGNFPNYGITEWGLTASDDPFGYRAHGAPPAQNDNGTITPSAAGGSVAFAPEISVASLRHMYRTYGSRLWGKYGFRDAYNVEENWFGSAWLGIDQGPFVIMIENLERETVWTRFMTLPEVQAGLAAAGFQPGVGAESGAEPGGLRLMVSGPNPNSGATSLTYALAEPTHVRLVAYDMLGRQVAVVADRETAAGAHIVPLDTRTWAPGLYVVRLSAGDETTTVQLIVAR